MSNAKSLSELGGSYGTGGMSSFKNRIINGAMVIDQRNAGASVTGNDGVYTLDRTFQYKHNYNHSLTDNLILTDLEVFLI